MSKQLNLKLLALIAGGLLAAGCTSNGDGSGGTTGGTTGGSTGGSTSGSTTGATTGGIVDSTGVPPNDGTAPTNVTEGGTALTGGFVCSRGALAYGAATTQIGTAGLVGGPLTTLLNTLGGTTVTQLLNSVSSPDRVIDGDLGSYASVSLTAGLLGGLLTSIDESVLLPSPQTVPVGKYAVFGISFPAGTADVNLLNSVTVTTFLGGVAQDSNTLNQSALALIAQSLVSNPAAGFIGVKTTQPYDTAQISLVPGLLSVSVGDAMRVHELCVDGSFVAP